MPDTSPTPPRPELRRHACQRCWSRKQKCDRASPKCSACRQVDAECVPRTLGSANDGGLDLPLAVVGEGYVQGLKRRIGYWEDLQRTKRPRASRTPNESQDELIAEQGPAAGDQLSLHDALADFGQFALNAAPTDTTSCQQSSTSSLSLWHLLKQAMQPAHPSDYPAANSSVRFPLRMQHDVVMSTLQDYSEHILPLYPYMENTALLQHGRDVALAHAREDFPQPSNSNVHGLVLVYAAMATVYSATRKSPDQSFQATQLRARAASMCTILSGSEATLPSQSMAALAVCVLYGEDLAMSSRLSRMAISNAVAGGLHRLKSTAPSTISREHQNDCSLFWTIYAMDRFISFATGSPHAIADADICTQAEPHHSDPTSSQIHDTARLLSLLHRNRDKPRMYFTHVYHAWKEAAASLSTSEKLSKEVFLRLKCRLLVCLYQTPSTTCVNTIAPLGLNLDDTVEAVETCKQWLMEMELHHDAGTAWTCCLDPCEITATSIMCMAINKAPQNQTHGRCSAACSEVYVLAVSLLSYLSTAYPAAAQMRRALSALHKLDGSLLESCLRDMELSKMVPRKVRTMLQEFPLGG